MKKENDFDILPYIPTGHRNAVTRSELCRRTGRSDRRIRDDIAAARLTAVIVNLQDSKGYFIPNKEDYIDYLCTKVWYSQECSREKSHKETLKPAKKWLEGNFGT